MTFAAEEAEGQWDVLRGFFRLAGCRRRRLPHGQAVLAFLRVKVILDGKSGCAGLAVPAAKRGEIAAGAGLHRLDEILAGDRLVVMALDVDFHALLKGVFADQCVDHADHLRALLVDGRRIKIIDLDIAFRAHRVGERTAVLDELVGAQAARVLDAFDRAAVHVGGEFLVPKDGEPFLQGELEPVPAGDAVAGPVVEIFMGDDALDAVIVGVRRRFRPRQNKFGVEHVQPLVLHRPHIEVGDGGDHELVEVVFEAEALLVPAHAVLEGTHRMAAFVDLIGLGVDLECYVAARTCDERIFEYGKVAGDQGEEIGGLGKRIFPDGIMPPARTLAAIHLITVGQ